MTAPQPEREKALRAERDALKARVGELLVIGQEMIEMIESVDYEPAGDAGPSNEDLNRWHTALRPEEVAIPNTVDEVYLGDGPDPEVVRRRKRPRKDAIPGTRPDDL